MLLVMFLSWKGVQKKPIKFEEWILDLELDLSSLFQKIFNYYSFNDE